VIAHTKDNGKKISKVSIYAENEYIVVENSNSKTNIQIIDKIKQDLQKDIPPLRSISLYVINYFCQNMTNNGQWKGKTIIINIKESNTFVIKIPLLKID
jgi:hypothetical protein